MVEARVHDAVTVAFAVIEVAVVGQVTVRPVAGATADVKLIVPAKLNVLVRVTVIADPVAPLLKLTGEPAEMLKSPTCETKLTL